MKCEICNAIERLGLDDSAHDLWHCTNASLVKTARRESRSYLREIGRRVQGFARTHSRYYRMATLAYHRRALVTLGL